MSSSSLNYMIALTVEKNNSIQQLMDDLTALKKHVEQGATFPIHVDGDLVKNLREQIDQSVQESLRGLKPKRATSMAGLKDLVASSAASKEEAKSMTDTLARLSQAVDLLLTKVRGDAPDTPPLREPKVSTVEDRANKAAASLLSLGKAVEGLAQGRYKSPQPGQEDRLLKVIEQLPEVFRSSLLKEYMPDVQRIKDTAAGKIRGREFANEDRDRKQIYESIQDLLAKARAGVGEVQNKYRQPDSPTPPDGAKKLMLERDVAATVGRQIGEQVVSAIRELLPNLMATDLANRIPVQVAPSRNQDGGYSSDAVQYAANALRGTPDQQWMQQMKQARVRLQRAVEANDLAAMREGAKEIESMQVQRAANVVMPDFGAVPGQRPSRVMSQYARQLKKAPAFGSLAVVESEAEAQWVEGLLRDQKRLGIDIETDPKSGKIRAIQLGLEKQVDGVQSVVMDLAKLSNNAVKRILQFVSRDDIAKVGSNLVFEESKLQSQFGVSLGSNLVDTMMRERALYRAQGNYGEIPKGLSTLSGMSARYLGYTPAKSLQTSFAFNDRPLSAGQARYASMDAVLPLLIAEAQERAAQEVSNPERRERLQQYFTRSGAAIPGLSGFVDQKDDRLWSSFSGMEIESILKGVPLEQVLQGYATGTPLTRTARTLETTRDERMQARVMQAARWYGRQAPTDQFAIGSLAAKGLVPIPGLVGERIEKTASFMRARFPLQAVSPGVANPLGVAEAMNQRIRDQMREVNDFNEYNQGNYSAMPLEMGYTLANLLRRRLSLDAKQRRYEEAKDQNKPLLGLTAVEWEDRRALTTQNLYKQFPVLEKVPGRTLAQKLLYLERASDLAASESRPGSSTRTTIPMLGQDGYIDRDSQLTLSPHVLERMKASGVPQEEIEANRTLMNTVMQREGLTFYYQSSRRQARVQEKMGQNLALIQGLQDGYLPKSMVDLLGRTNESFAALPKQQAGMSEYERRQVAFDRDRILNEMMRDPAYRSWMEYRAQGVIDPTQPSVAIRSDAYKDVLEGAKTRQALWALETLQGGVFARPGDPFIAQRGMNVPGLGPTLLTSKEMREGKLLMDVTKIGRADVLMSDMLPPGMVPPAGPPGSGSPWAVPPGGVMPVRVMNWNEFPGVAQTPVGDMPERSPRTQLRGMMAEKDLLEERQLQRALTKADVLKATAVAEANEKARARAAAGSESAMLREVRELLRNPTAMLEAMKGFDPSELPTRKSREAYAASPALFERDLSRFVNKFLTAVESTEASKLALISETDPLKQGRGLMTLEGRMRREEAARYGMAQLMAIDPRASVEQKQQTERFLSAALPFQLAQAGLGAVNRQMLVSMGLEVRTGEREQQLVRARGLQARLAELSEQKRLADQLQGNNALGQVGLDRLAETAERSYESAKLEQAKALAKVDRLTQSNRGGTTRAELLPALQAAMRQVGYSEEQIAQAQRQVKLMPGSKGVYEAGTDPLTGKPITKNSSLVDLDAVQKLTEALFGPSATLPESPVERKRVDAERLRARADATREKAPQSARYYEDQIFETKGELMRTLGVSTPGGVETRMARLEKAIDLARQKMAGLGEVSQKTLQTMAKELGRDIQSVDDLKKAVDDLEKEYKALSASVDEAAVSNQANRADAGGGGGGGRTLGESFLAKVMSLGQYTMAGSVVYTFANVLRNTTRAVVDFEADLKRIQGVLESRSERAATQLGQDIVQSARDYGVSVAEPLRAAKVFAQIGASQSEIERLSRASVVAQQGAGLEAGQASELLIAARNITDGRVSPEDITDRLARVEARYAVSAQDLSEAIQRAGSLATQLQPNQLGGIDALDTVIGATTAIVERTRLSGNQAATSLRFMISRLTAPEVTRELQDRYKIPLAGSNPNEMRPLLDILSNISRRYLELQNSGQTVQATELLTTFAGARQANVAAALLTDFDKVIQAATTSSLAFGDAQERAALQLDTVQARQAQLSASFFDLTNTLLDSSGALTAFKLGLRTLSFTLGGTADLLKNDGVGGVLSSAALAGGGAWLAGNSEKLAGKAITRFLGAEAAGGAIGVAATGGLASMMSLLGTVTAVLAGVGALVKFNEGLLFNFGIGVGSDPLRVRGKVSDELRQQYNTQANEVGARYNLSGDEVISATQTAFGKAIQNVGADRFDRLITNQTQGEARRQDARAFENALRDNFKQIIPEFANISNDAEALSQAFEMLRLTTIGLSLENEQQRREGRKARDEIMSGLNSASQLVRQGREWGRDLQMGPDGTGFDNKVFLDQMFRYGRMGGNLLPDFSQMQFNYGPGVGSLSIQQRMARLEGANPALGAEGAATQAMRELIDIPSDMRLAYEKAYTDLTQQKISQQLSQGERPNFETVMPTFAELATRVEETLQRGTRTQAARSMTPDERVALERYDQLSQAIGRSFVERTDLGDNMVGVGPMNSFASVTNRYIKFIEDAINRQLTAAERMGETEQVAQLRATLSAFAREDVRDVTMANIRELSGDFVNIRQRYLTPFINLARRQSDIQTGLMLQERGFQYDDLAARGASSRAFVEELGQIRPTLLGENLQSVLALATQVRVASPDQMIEMLENGNQRVLPGVAQAIRSAPSGGASLDPAQLNTQRARITMQLRMIDSLQNNFTSLFDSVPGLSDELGNIRKRLSDAAAVADSAGFATDATRIGSFIQNLTTAFVKFDEVLTAAADKAAQINREVVARTVRFLDENKAVLEARLAGETNLVTAQIASQGRAGMATRAGRPDLAAEFAAEGLRARLGLARTNYDAELTRQTKMLAETMNPTNPLFAVRLRELTEPARTAFLSEQNNIPNQIAQIRATEVERVRNLEATTARQNTLRNLQTGNFDTLLGSEQSVRNAELESQRRAGQFQRSGRPDLVGVQVLRTLEARERQIEEAYVTAYNAATVVAAEGGPIPGKNGSADRAAYEERVAALREEARRQRDTAFQGVQGQRDTVLQGENERRLNERRQQTNAIASSITDPLKSVLGDYRKLAEGGGTAVLEGIAGSMQQLFANRFVDSLFGESGLMGNVIRDAFDNGAFLLNEHLLRTFEAGAQILSQGVSAGMTGSPTPQVSAALPMRNGEAPTLLGRLASANRGESSVMAASLLNGLPDPKSVRRGGRPSELDQAALDRWLSQFPAGTKREEMRRSAEFIASWESYRENSYADSTGTQTIGFGTTYLDGKRVVPGMTLSRARATEIMLADLQDRARQLERQEVPVNAATLSWAYNHHPNQLKRRSNRPFREALQAEDWETVIDMLPQYNRSRGQRSRGLTNRRNAEIDYLREYVLPEQDASPTRNLFDQWKPTTPFTLPGAERYWRGRMGDISQASAVDPSESLFQLASADPTLAREMALRALAQYQGGSGLPLSGNLDPMAEALRVWRERIKAAKDSSDAYRNIAVTEENMYPRGVNFPSWYLNGILREPRAAEGGQLPAVTRVARNREGQLFGNPSEPRNANLNSIILHSTESDTMQTALSFLEQEGNSYHYLVDRNGEIVQMVDPALRGQHVGFSTMPGLGGGAIGISMVGHANRGYTDAQYAAITTLTQQLQQKYPDITNDRIAYHSDVAYGYNSRGQIGSRRGDPGRRFDYARYLRGIGGTSGLGFGKVAPGSRGGKAVAQGPVTLPTGYGTNYVPAGERYARSYAPYVFVPSLESFAPEQFQFPNVALSDTLRSSFMPDLYETFPREETGSPQSVPNEVQPNDQRLLSQFRELRPLSWSQSADQFFATNPAFGRQTYNPTLRSSFMPDLYETFPREETGSPQSVPNVSDGTVTPRSDSSTAHRATAGRTNWWDLQFVGSPISLPPHGSTARRYPGADASVGLQALTQSPFGVRPQRDLMTRRAHGALSVAAIAAIGLGVPEVAPPEPTFSELAPPETPFSALTPAARDERIQQAMQEALSLRLADPAAASPAAVPSATMPEVGTLKPEEIERTRIINQGLMQATEAQRLRKQQYRNVFQSGAQMVGSLGGAQLGGGAKTYAPEGASLGTTVGSLAAALPIVAAIPGLNIALPLIGGLLGGLFGGQKKKDQPDVPIEALAKIERNTRQQVELLQTQTSLLQLESRFLNVGAGFTVPQYRPYGVGGSGGVSVGDITVTVNTSSGASAKDIGQEVARAIQSQLSQAGLAFDTRTM